MTDAPEIFKTRQDVFEYLKAQGNKISKTKLYRDVANGKLHVQKDGTVLMKDVMYYIQHPAANLSPVPVSSPDFDDVQIRKAKADARKSEAQALLAEQKAGLLAGSLIEKDMFYGELAARASLFRSDMINFFRARAAEMIAIVDGDVKKAPDLIDLCFDELEKALGNYAADKDFAVPVVSGVVVSSDGDESDEI